MELTRLIAGTLGAFCECGRGRIPIHCRSCGSRNKYVRTANSRIIELEGNINIRAQGFRCRYCGADYDESMKCEVPRAESKGKLGGTETKTISVEQAQAIVYGTERTRSERLDKLFAGQPPLSKR